MTTTANSKRTLETETAGTLDLLSVRDYFLADGWVLMLNGDDWAIMTDLDGPDEVILPDLARSAREVANRYVALADELERRAATE